MIEVGKIYYYIGVGVAEWKNQIVKVLQDTGDKVGTNRDVSVYLCEDENGTIKRVVECNLSLEPFEYKFVSASDTVNFPEGVKTFPTYKNGKYMYEYTWGKY